MKAPTGNINSTLEIRQFELVRLRIGYLNNCNFSIALHFNELKNFGESEIRLLLVSIWKDVPHFSEKERALFALTDYIIGPNNNNEKQETIHLLLEQHFTNEQIAHLIQAIKQIDLWTQSMKHTNELRCPKKKHST